MKEFLMNLVFHILHPYRIVIAYAQVMMRKKEFLFSILNSIIILAIKILEIT